MEPVDLTLTISQDLPTFPGSPQPQFIPWNQIQKDGYNLEMLFLSSHSGTHMDAPYHFVKKGSRIDDFPVNRFVCNAVLLRIRRGPNQPIAKSDIIRFEKKHGKIPEGSSVIFATGWQQRNLQKRMYFEKNPGLELKAATYLASKKINLVGIDSPSIDLGSDSAFSVHHILLKNNILIVENLANLEKIPSIYFKLAVLPLKIKDATGSPVRAIALP